MITEGYLGLHYRGRRGGREPALLDVAQDYALKVIFDSGLYELGLIFKGGTALRKFRIGSKGRFSTDLDFSVDDEAVGKLLLETLDGYELFDVRFRVFDDRSGLRGSLGVETPLGNPQIDSKIEVSTRGTWLPGEWLEPIPMPVHKGFEFASAKARVMALEETLAEKLAAFRRRALIRDLYDLALFETGAFDEALVRELTFLKVFMDVVEDGLGERPFDPHNDILRPRSSADFPAEDIGVLAGEIDVDLWIGQVRSRFAFLQQATTDQLRWGRCDPRDAYEVRQTVSGLRG